MSFNGNQFVVKVRRRLKPDFNSRAAKKRAMLCLWGHERPLAGHDPGGGSGGDGIGDKGYIEYFVSVDPGMYTYSMCVCTVCQTSHRELLTGMDAITFMFLNSRMFNSRGELRYHSLCQLRTLSLSLPLI